MKKIHLIDGSKTDDYYLATDVDIVIADKDAQLVALQSRLDAANERIIELEQLLDWAREWVKQESLWNQITAALASAAGQEQEA